MLLTAALAVLGAALAALGLSRAAHYAARRHHLPDAGPAVGTAAGVVFSFFILTLAFLLVSSTQEMSAARRSNYAETGALVDVYLAAGPLQEPLRGEIREHAQRYAHLVIDQEWPLMEHGEFDADAYAMALGLRLLAAKIPADAPAKASDDIRAAVGKLFEQRRVRMADARGGLPTPLLVTLIGAAVGSVLFLLLIGWPLGRRGRVAIAAVGAICGFGIWLVLQLNHAYGSGIHVDPDAFHEALERMAFISAHGV